MKPIIIFLLISSVASAQRSYKDSLQKFQKQYINTHEVVKGDDRKFLSFYGVNKSYRVKARFERINNGMWFKMPTSGTLQKPYRIYGVLHFSIHDTLLTLNVYQSQNLMETEQYKNYLFVPFTDLTTGNTSYETGRYIDLTTEDIVNGTVILDFNKAYNPYCAYTSGYNCPIPPKENDLPIAIMAGEKKYGKTH